MSENNTNNQQEEVKNPEQTQQNTDSNQPTNGSEKSAENKISELEQKNSELNDKVLRLLAELDNVRRRSQEELEKSAKYAITKFVTDLTAPIEHFFLASDNAPKEEIEANPKIKNFADAVLMTKSELMKILEKHQVKRIFPLNEKFDHHFHEAISQVENNEVEDGTVLQVFQAGYSLESRLIKPALVVVAKKG